MIVNLSLMPNRTSQNVHYIYTSSLHDHLSHGSIVQSHSLLLILVRYLHLGRQSDGLEKSHDTPSHVKLPPLQAMSCRVLESMVVVVPSFSKCKQCHPPKHSKKKKNIHLILTVQLKFSFAKALIYLYVYRCMVPIVPGLIAGLPCLLPPNVASRVNQPSDVIYPCNPHTLPWCKLPFSIATIFYMW